MENESVANTKADEVREREGRKKGEKVGKCRKFKENQFVFMSKQHIHGHKRTHPYFPTPLHSHEHSQTHVHTHTHTHGLGVGPKNIR